MRLHTPQDWTVWPTLYWGLGSHCSNLTIEWSFCAPSRNSSMLSLPSLFLSIRLNILSVLFSGVASSSGSWTSVPIILYIDATISIISFRVMYPLPSRSYILNAHFSFWSSFPLEVTLRAQRNSLKSIVPSPFASKVLNTCIENLEASPDGKSPVYIFLNSEIESLPLGQSRLKPMYQSWISASEKLVLALRSLSISGASLLWFFPILSAEFSFSQPSHTVFFSVCCVR